MRESELAVIVSPGHTGHSTDFQASSRYLSHCGGGADAEIAVVFPLEDGVTVAATHAHDRWGDAQNWVTDLREADDDYGSRIIDRLREIGIGNARVGVVGMGPGTRTAEGITLWETMRRLIREFPRTTFVDATPILERARLVKSEEEIDCLRRSTALVDDAFDAEVAAAVPGVPDYVVWARTRAAMLRGGSEAALHCNWVSGPAPARTLTRPSFRTLERGDIILNEIESSWSGYRAQGIQPVSVESCDPVYSELMKVQGAVFDEMMAMLRPGATLGELRQACRDSAIRHCPQTGPAAGARATLIMHGRGLGDDGPILTNSARDPRHLRTALLENMVFILKPQLRTASGTHPINWGDTVVVTAHGGRQLGRRDHGIRVAHGSVAG